MSEGQIVSLVGLLAWLVLVASGYRAHRIGAKQSVIMALVWAAIITGAALVFGTMR